MARGRKHNIELPTHVHLVKSKGKNYYFYQAHRGTARRGQRTALPRDPTTAEFWAKLREVSGTVVGYTGTVAAMIDAYLASPEFTGLSASGQSLYSRYLNNSRLAIGSHKPDAIRPVHVLALRDQFQSTPGAANMVIKALSAVFKWGRPRDYAVNNPCQKIPLFVLGEHQPWPVDMIALILANARWEIKRFFSLTLATAQREGDICRMSLRDIVDHEVRVIQEKTGKELWIPLEPVTKKIVQECRKAGTMYLIPKANGKPYTANQFRNLWAGELKRNAALAPVKAMGLVPHGLCKNAHNILFESGSTDAEVQAVTGRSPTMVRHYSKARDQRTLARTAVNKRQQSGRKVLQSRKKT